MKTYPITTQAHTGIIQIASRVEETRTYIRRVDPQDHSQEIRKKAWEEQWFGFISESIFIRLMPTLYHRYGKYPKLLKILKTWLGQGMENHDFKLICHLHIQLADPYYRWVSGTCLPSRFREGLFEINSQILVPLLVKELQGKLQHSTIQKIARNLLTTARDCGTLKGKQNKLREMPVVSVEHLGYLLYTLQLFNYPINDIPESPYVQSLFSDQEAFQALLAEGQRKQWWEFNWENQIFTLTFQSPDIQTWFDRAIQ